jgi:uncharacterized lipoprotein YajG
MVKYKGVETIGRRKPGMARFTFILILLTFLSGCALTKEHITIDYTPQTNIEPIKGSEKVNLKVNINDSRSMRDKVSYKKNTYGMELGEIISNNDIVGLVSESVKNELQNRGFNVSGGDVEVNIELIKFYNDFKTGFFAGDASAEVIMGVQVKQKNGNVTFNKTITGAYVEQDTQIATGNNAKKALEGALKDAVPKLVNDSKFIIALMESSRSSSGSL